MIRPHWLAKLKPRQERKRAAAGLIAKRDGWYKTFDGKTRYICKPCPLDNALAVLPNRIAKIRADQNGQSQAIAVRMTPGAMTLDAVADAYQAWLYQRLTTGVPRKLARRTYDDAIQVVGEFVECAGPSKLADNIGPTEFSAYALKHLSGIASSSVRRKMIYVEAFANWAAPGSRKAGLLIRPWVYGQDFRKPSMDEITTSAADSDKAYTPEQLRRAFLRVKKHPLMRAVGWLALCGAFGPKDLGLLPEALVDLDSGEIRFPRGKTGVGRLCWLPPAARIAVRKYITSRPEPASADAELLLLRTTHGLPCYRDATGEDHGCRTDVLSRAWSDMTGLPLSGLRSTFATLADDFPDQRAVDVVMGHKSGAQVRSIRNKHYAKKFSAERVQKLVSVVLPLAFGRKIPSSASPSSPPSGPTLSAGQAGSRAKPPRLQGQSSTAAPKSRATAHQKPEARQP